MKTKLLIAVILLTSSMFWSCQDVVLIDRVDELEAIETEFVQEEMSLKSTEFITDAVCIPKQIPLIAGQNSNVGSLIISNTADVLNVEFSANSSCTIKAIHLWVGINGEEVPMNKNKIPIPGKFPISGRNISKYCFKVKLADIDTNVDALLNGKTIYLFAHAVVTNNVTGATESAWSQGKTFGTKRWGTYSVYACCDPQVVTAGCYPHMANCGNKFDGVYFYDNTKGGSQKIVADNGEVAGTVVYTNGKFYFNFTQDWMFTNLLPDPVVLIHGCDNPTTNQTIVYSDKPEYNQGPYTATVSYYPYYKLELNIQHCTTR